MVSGAVAALRRTSRTSVTSTASTRTAPPTGTTHHGTRPGSSPGPRGASTGGLSRSTTSNRLSTGPSVAGSAPAWRASCTSDTVV